MMYLTTTAQVECVRSIQAGSLSVLRMLNDILDYARLESGTLVLDEFLFDLHKVS